MTAACKLCGFSVSVHHPAHILWPSIPTEKTELIALGEFDLMAAKMTQHIFASHREETASMTSVQFLAGKLYAISLLQNPDSGEFFSRLYAAWKNEIITMLQRLGEPQGVVDAAAFASSPSSDPSGS